MAVAVFLCFGLGFPDISLGSANRTGWAMLELGFRWPGKAASSAGLGGGFGGPEGHGWFPVDFPCEQACQIQDTGVWLKIKQEGLRRFWSMLPLTRVPFWYRLFEPQPQLYTTRPEWSSCWRHKSQSILGSLYGMQVDGRNPLRTVWAIPTFLEIRKSHLVRTRFGSSTLTCEMGFGGFFRDVVCMGIRDVSVAISCGSPPPGST